MFDDETERALTLNQPWATLIIEHTKRIENRPWKSETVRGRRIWIHTSSNDRPLAEEGLAKASLTGFKLEDSTFGGYVRSAILGSVLVLGFHRRGDPDSWNKLAPEARLIYEENEEQWYDARGWAWILTAPWALPEPIPCPGSRRLWTPDSLVLARARMMRRLGKPVGPDLMMRRPG